MKLASYSINGERKTGVVKDGGLVDLGRLDSALNLDLMTIVEQGEPVLAKIHQLVADSPVHVGLDDVVL